MISRNRVAILGKCDDCGEETKVYRFNHCWLCEYCLNLAEETL